MIRWLTILRRDFFFFVVMVFITFFLLTTLVPGVFARYSPYEQHPRDALKSPSGQYWLGTDQFGRDIYSRAIYGGRVAILVGLGSVALAMLVGVPLGLISGYYGGTVDAVIMRIQDALLAFPAVILALLIIASFGASAINVVLTIAFVYVPRFARLVRGSVLDLKEREYVLASRAFGANDIRLLFMVILPNAIAPIIVQATLGIAVAILIESGLSYLGLGIQPPTASWGNMLQHAQSYIHRAPWFVLAPGSFIFVAVLVFNLAGDRLREIIDPRLRTL
jgi:ABC-type dipeptide/oligopeptide/nickel transport system permease subunit